MSARFFKPSFTYKFTFKYASSAETELTIFLDTGDLVINLPIESNWTSYTTGNFTIDGAQNSLLIQYSNTNAADLTFKIDELTLIEQ